MFPTAYPDISGQLANDRVADLRADGDRFRRSRGLLAMWRPARIVEPAPDLSRVVPSAPHVSAPHVKSSGTGRAA
jgi:hypothetical protein